MKLGIALVPEGRRLFPDMTVEQNLRVAGGKGRAGPWTVDTVLDAFPILRPLARRTRLDACPEASSRRPRSAGR